MRSKTLLKNLAQSVVEDGKIDEKQASSVLSKLNKADLRVFLSFLKNELTKKRVYVKTSDVLDQDIKKDLEEKFMGREIIFEEDKNIGAGIVVRDGYNIIDSTVKSYINQSINKLKSNL